MKRILSSRKHHYLKRVGIFLIAVALIVGMVGCEEVPHSLTMAANPMEGGTATDLTAGAPYHAANTSVNIQAVANPGYRFVNWSSAPAGAGTFGSDTDETTTFIMPDLDVTVTANFAPFAGGNGTAKDPYQIADWYQLDNVRNYLDSYFILINDLDSTTFGYTEVASPTANGGEGWQPIGSVNASYDLVDPFTGTFDGQGYKISDLFINRPDEWAVGLFGAAIGVIGNVGVVDADVTGGYGTGILVAGNGATLYSCYSSGSVSGSDNVGGLVGGNIGNIFRSYSTASVSGGYAGGSPIYYGVGGLVGQNEGTIIDCYATGSVAGVGKVGGLVGWNYDGFTVDSSYSTGSVTGSGEIGGLVGWNDGTVSNSFWDTATSGLATSDGGMGRTTAQMKDFDTFDGAGWDIITVANSSTRNTGYVWNIVDGGTYPFLNWQP